MDEINNTYYSNVAWSLDSNRLFYSVLDDVAGWGDGGDNIDVL
jgi:hypothetical protein